MELKESTFAIIAEKKDSISHKWFNENSKKTTLWDAIGWYYLYDGKKSQTALCYKPNVPIYTESEFEAFLKAEQENEAKPTISNNGESTNIVYDSFKTPLTATDYPNIEVKAITISYNLALEYIAERLNVDKGIIKIEMP